MGKAQPNRARKLALRLTIASLSALVTILILEIALRLFFPYLPVDIAYAIRHVRVTPFGKMRLIDYLNAPVALTEQGWSHWLIPDNDYLHYLKADVRNFLFNATPNVSFLIDTYSWTEADRRVGFRTPPPANGELDIVALGDSMTFCWTDIADCWTTKLSEQLGRSVANLGIPATGALSHANVYRDFVKPDCRPKIVLWQFFHNDPLDDVRHRGRLEFVPTHPITPWLHDHSVVYSLIKHFVQNFGKPPDNPQTLPESSPTLIQHGNVTLSINPMWTGWDAEQLAIGMALGKRAILETRAAVEREGGTFVLLVFPDFIELYERILMQLAPDDLSLPFAQLTAIRMELRAFCAEEGLLCLDLYDVLVNHIDKQLIYPDEGHYAPDGNALIAAAVADFLRQNGLAQARQ